MRSLSCQRSVVVCRKKTGTGTSTGTGTDTGTGKVKARGYYVCKTSKLK